MIPILVDEDFNARIIRGVLRRASGLDLRTIHHAGLAGQTDPLIVSWAAAKGRVLLTHDLNTMIDAALDRIRESQSMPGLIAVPQQLGIGIAIADLVLIVSCMEPEEIEGQILYLPL